MDERRARYRIDAADTAATEVALARAGADPEPTELIDVTIDGAAVRFPHARAPSIAVGDRVVILLGAVDQALRVDAVVIHRREDPEHRRYGLRFLDPDSLAERLGPALAKLFNRRGAPRVQPDPREPVEITLEGFLAAGGVERTQAPLIDLSTGGLATEVGYAFEAGFAGNIRVRATFELPGIDEPFNLGAVIQNRRSVDHGVLYGLEFDPDRTLHFPRQRRAIADYVARRYREGASQRRK